MKKQSTKLSDQLREADTMHARISLMNKVGTIIKRPSIFMGIGRDRNNDENFIMWNPTTGNTYTAKDYEVDTQYFLTNTTYAE